MSIDIGNLIYVVLSFILIILVIFLAPLFDCTFQTQNVNDISSN